MNVGREKKEKCFPKNTCQLYKGIYGGIPLFFLFYLFVPLLVAFLVALVNGVAGPFSIIAGYMPNPGFWLLKNNTELFYPYERIGSKKWIAPWKFILPIGLVALVYFFYREIFTGLVKVSHPLSSKTAMIVYGSIAGLIFLVIVINKIRKIESFVAGKETIVSFLKKMCKEIEIRE